MTKLEDMSYWLGEFELLYFEDEISASDILSELYQLHSIEGKEFAFDEHRSSTRLVKENYSSMPWRKSRFIFLRERKNCRIVGSCRCHFPHSEDHANLVFLYLYVLPEFRRRGLGTWLIKESVKEMEKARREFVIFIAYSQVECGELFLTELGARKCNIRQINRLYLEKLDFGLMQNWIEKGDKARFEVLFWEKLIPEEYLAQFLEINWYMNDAPIGNLQIKKHQMTSKEWREYEGFLRDRGCVLWAVVIQDIQTKSLCGYTTTIWDSTNPDCLNQGDTVVHRNFRGNGLGRWMKADMIMRVIQQRPNVQYVVTGNANGNIPMLKINHQMGFQIHQEKVEWQISLDELQAHYQKLGGVE